MSVSMQSAVAQKETSQLGKDWKAFPTGTLYLLYRVVKAN